MPESWSLFEVAATVASYLDMLELELRGERYNKAQFNRELRSVLNERSKGAVEFKHENISALMIEFGLPYIDGYKPRANYQELLRQEILAQWNVRPVLTELASVAASWSVELPRCEIDPSAVFTSPPARATKPAGVRETPRAPAPPRLGVNYLELESRNAALGRAGEEFVLELESRRLHEAGAARLAGRVEHVARTRGDGLGYDILSFERDGRERLIEVKTTSFGAMTPFYASRREVAVSAQRAEHYKLYRLYKFRTAPRVFVLDGQLDQNCLLEPASFIATPR